MSNFINTIDVLGDEVVLARIIEGTIEEFRDNRIELIETRAFYYCTKLRLVDIPNCKQIVSSNAFESCDMLDCLILRNTEMVALNGKLANNPIANGTGYIYVPSNLVDTYKAHSFWKNHASQFRAIEDYPDICG